MKKTLALMVALLLLGCSMAGCAAKTKPPSAIPVAAEGEDALKVLDLLVQFHQIYDLSFGDGQALLEVEFYVDGKSQGSGNQIGPISSENAGKFTFAVIEHSIAGQSVYKVAVAEMDRGATYMLTYSADERRGGGARYQIAQTFEPDALAPNVRTPICGLFYTTETVYRPDATIEDTLPLSAAAVVFYITVQQ